MKECETKLKHEVYIQQNKSTTKHFYKEEREQGETLNQDLVAEFSGNHGYERGSLLSRKG